MRGLVRASAWPRLQHVTCRAAARAIPHASTPTGCRASGQRLVQAPLLLRTFPWHTFGRVSQAAEPQRAARDAGVYMYSRVGSALVQLAAVALAARAFGKEAFGY